mmetsp:Transcript_29226/g.87023  ORF Transcript_29226/g.87023 Transcript_29226/m.87023 type:complete len:259 (-) Transcript_29226:347-1123(-)
MAAEARLLVAAEAACPSCALLPCRAAGLGLLRRGVGEDGGGRRGGRRRLACHGVLARLEQVARGLEQCVAGRLWRGERRRLPGEEAEDGGLELLEERRVDEDLDGNERADPSPRQPKHNLLHRRLLLLLRQRVGGLAGVDRRQLGRGRRRRRGLGRRRESNQATEPPHDLSARIFLVAPRAGSGGRRPHRRPSQRRQLVKGRQRHQRLIVHAKLRPARLAGRRGGRRSRRDRLGRVDKLRHDEGHSRHPRLCRRHWDW